MKDYDIDNENIKIIFEYAIKGLKKLKTTYQKTIQYESYIFEY